MITAQGKRLLKRWIYVLVKVEDDFLVPFTHPALKKIADDPSYPAEFNPFLKQFLETLNQPEWEAGTYFPGAWYRALVAHGRNPLAVEITGETLSPFTVEEARVDAQGRWFVGRKRIEGRVLSHFLRNLAFDVELQRYRIRYRLDKRYETRYLHHESPPFRVRRLVRKGGNAVLWLNDGSQDLLHANTLYLDKHERLFCAVKPQQVPALIEDKPRWELLKTAEHRGDHLLIFLDGQVIELPIGGLWVYADQLPV